MSIYQINAGGLGHYASGGRVVGPGPSINAGGAGALRRAGNWKATGILPYIKIGRRCPYDWASVQGAVLRRQKGGQ